MISITLLSVSTLTLYIIRLLGRANHLCSQSLYLGGKGMMAVASVSLIFLYLLCLWSHSLVVTGAYKMLYLLCKTILKVRYLTIIL